MPIHADVMGMSFYAHEDRLPMPARNPIGSEGLLGEFYVFVFT